MSETAGHNGNSPAITREYLDSLLVEMRTIDSVPASAAVKLYGTDFATPIMVAALSGLDQARPQGMVETAKGAAAAGAVMWTGIGSEAELESLIATGAKTIKIIKPYADQDLIYRKIAHAEKAGALAVGMDIDYVFGRKSSPGFAMEFPVSPKTSRELRDFVAATKLPFILKGILSEQDARKALEIGAGGIVISHHAGIIDYAVPPLLILPKIARIVRGQMPIFVDCGIAKGTDAFKALALGASAVSVGRPLVEGLKADGSEGVKKVLEDITKELIWTMEHTGADTLHRIDPAVIWNFRGN
jgi:isopentenyl diphosphate isomerase/L-lactate dehydrogenase-like FMN-dependent dehydrogenase